MNRILPLACLGLLCLPPQFAGAHGTPINVSGANNVFTISNGVSDDVGFAPQMFFESDEEGDPFGDFDLDNVGPVIIWTVPGFSITSMSNSGSLSIDVLARPVKDSNPVELRTLWYWNSDPDVKLVEPATSDFHLLGTGDRFITLTPNDNAAPPPFLLTPTLTGQQNTHNHGLLSYALEDSETTAVGAYGFFARLISSQLGPSDPFLIVFNNGVDHEQMAEAALAINAAAADSESLPGDYNHDGTVDAADYIVWRKPLPSDGGYSTWKTNFGRTLNGGGGASMNSQVPEPTSAVLFVCAFGFVAIARRNRGLATSYCGR